MKHTLAIVIILFLLIFALKISINPPGGETATLDKNENIPDKIEFRYHIRPILSDKCFKCHGPDEAQLQADLRLDLESEAMKVLTENPGKYAIVPGDPTQSELIKRINSDDPAVMMPPPGSNLKLSEQDKILLEKWIQQGAEYQPHWAFLQVKKTPLPGVTNEKWPANEIDHFILAKLEEKELTPSEPDSRENLIRRVSLDLTGLPPGYEQVVDFVTDDDPGAWERVVDELLDSKAYGERMARIWLDVARYADSHGYQDDSYRSMWPWRDWVIHAFNTNMPYDRFLREQLAGDLIPDATKGQILATGFNRNHPITQEGGVIDEEYRVEYVADRTNTLGKGIMGLTLECARCHDHKYDPISMKNYYGLFAFFNKVDEKGLRYDAVQAANRKYYADAPFIEIGDEDIQSILPFINKPDTGTVKVMVMNDSVSRETFVLERGNYDAPSTPVKPGTPEAILPFPDDLPADRLGLAEWLVSDKNPLTARVFVNRMWALLFGRGIVETVEDFGAQGSLPSHPGLLDWLAVDFMENNWDIKALLKKMVLSSTYRQRSVITPELKTSDPENIWLARGPRFRMSAEMIRDYALATSGLINRKIGGPSVKPYQPPGLWEETNAGNNRGILTSYQPDHGEKLYRRSIYTFWKRTLPPPAMTLFDAPSRDICEVRRQVTNTPLQALVIQNDVQMLEAARVLAQQLDTQDLSGQDGIRELCRNILLREPDSREMKVLSDYYADMKEKFEGDPEKAEQLVSVGEFGPDIQRKVNTAALMMTAQVLYNLDETITKE